MNNCSQTAGDAWIAINDKSHFPKFVELNEAWIKEYFDIEQVDIELFRNPGRIIEDGGSILSLTAGGEVRGVCALFKSNEREFELARMAVEDACRGCGYGTWLLQAAERRARELGATQLRLLSNTRLEAAIALYRSHGFEAVFEGQHGEYRRCNVIMQKTIRN